MSQITTRGLPNLLITRGLGIISDIREIITKTSYLKRET